MVKTHSHLSIPYNTHETNEQSSDYLIISISFACFRPTTINNTEPEIETGEQTTNQQIQTTTDTENNPDIAP